MANEYLQRTPTSTGNRRVWTWGGWVKKNRLATQQALFSAGNSSPAQRGHIRFDTSDRLTIIEDSGGYELITTQVFRDVGSWQHIIFVFDSTQTISSNRIRLYVNGVQVVVFTTSSYPSINFDSIFNQNVPTANGNLSYAGNIYPLYGELTDVFFVDGQALTPDVFGFYKQGKGYISVGSTQATDFRPGQWVPKTPRVIKTEINRRGGFGVNGFYLPMNDSNNFGADFHCDPNSIITLNEKLPQPRVGVATTASVGLGYTDALRADPYAANLVLAVPGVIGGRGSGYGDYSANIKGSGSNKTVTANGNAGVAATASYYGSALSFDGSGDYMEVIDNGDFSASGDFTVEFWGNLNSLASAQYFFAKWNSGANQREYLIEIATNGTVNFNWSTNGNTHGSVSSQSGLVSINQWNHYVWEKRNSTLSGYVNGVVVGIKTDLTSQYNNTSNPLYIGSLNSSTSSNVYIQDLRIYKGVAKYTGGFDVPRPYTPVGIATWRAVPDTTANNFATWTPNSGFIGRNSSNVRAGSVTLTDGNLTWYRQQNSIPIYSTANVRTGKWYWEYLIRGNTRTSYGIVQTPHDGGFGVEFGNAGDYAYMHEGGQTKIVNGSSSSAGSYFASVPAVNDIVGVAFDANTGQLWFSKNGTFGNSGNPSSGTNALITGITTDTQYNFAVFGAGDYPSSDTIQGSTNFGQNPTFSGSTTAGTFTDSNGKGLFKYQPPTGFLALCEDNLPTPAISDPGKYFKTVLWTGDGNSGRSIVGVGFTPDLVWIKSRTVARNHRLQDSVRGFTNVLSSDLTSAEYGTGDISSANNDGFSLLARDNQNISAESYVAWCWRAGAGTTSTNTNGSITSVVSVNQDAGFSIVSFRGNGSTGTVGHGLGRPPRMIIQKPRNAAASWAVYHASLGAGNAVWLNLTDASASYPTVWNSTAPTSSVYSVGSYMGTLDYIAYCWAEIEGFSKFGSWVSNANADGPFIYCGFKPALVICKTASGDVSNWVIADSSRSSVNDGSTSSLRANTANTEAGVAGGFTIDFLSNGFKLRQSGALNSAGLTNIFAAWAESPFQTANSK